MSEIEHQLKKLGDPRRAKVSLRYFKTGSGQYGEGDHFIGIGVPALRHLSKTYQDTPLHDIELLLRSAIHESRLLALLLLVRRFSRGNEAVQSSVYRLYRKNRRWVNNWDLVDASAEHIVGAYLVNRGREPLRELALSKTIWDRRIAIVSTFYFIKRGEYGETLRIARLLLNDSEDLIQKAVGWMLREVEKRSPKLAREFLANHYRSMPRVMLRYAIEKMPEPERRRYLAGEDLIKLLD